MEIPKKITTKGKEYIFVKEYARYILYQNIQTGTKECFTKLELGLIRKLRKKVDIAC